jgi:hypothetical protein
MNPQESSVTAAALGKKVSRQQLAQRVLDLLNLAEEEELEIQKLRDGSVRLCKVKKVEEPATAT